MKPLLLITLIALTGCAGDWHAPDNSRYYYKCDIPESWAKTVAEVYQIHVLPWKAFNKEAWERGFIPKETSAFIDFKDLGIFLKQGHSDDSLYHEAGGHAYDVTQGRVGHNMQCWSTSKPYGYDEKVRVFIDNLNNYKGELQ